MLHIALLCHWWRRCKIQICFRCLYQACWKWQRLYIAQKYMNAKLHKLKHFCGYFRDLIYPSSFTTSLRVIDSYTTGEIGSPLSMTVSAVFTARRERWGRSNPNLPVSITAFFMVLLEIYFSVFFQHNLFSHLPYVFYSTINYICRFNSFQKKSIPLLVIPRPFHFIYFRVNGNIHYFWACLLVPVSFTSFVSIYCFPLLHTFTSLLCSPVLLQLCCSKTKGPWALTLCFVTC